MLWSLLGEPKKGTQMGKNWIRDSTKTATMRLKSNLENRWVYLMLGLTANTNPFAAAAHTSSLKLIAAPGVGDHIAATLELLASNDHYNIELHNKHKNTHGITEMFDSTEIDKVEKSRIRANKLKSNKSDAQQEEPGRAKKAVPISKKKSNKL